MYLALAATAADIAVDQSIAVYDMLADYPVEVGVYWGPCGDDNAFYYPNSGSIVLCLELNETPAPVFAAAHEAGHALVLQLGLDPGFGGTAHEDAADELAALYLIESDQLPALVGGAQWFMDSGWGGDEDGVHANHMDRAWKLLCLASGAEGGSLECRTLYAMTRAKWAVQLDPHRL